MTMRSNIPDLSVSELALSLKRTLEDTYARVRVRGELSKVKVHSSGHLYSDLKDAEAVLNIICWRGTMAKLSITPEEGLDVICTGRITSYPARSNYQMVVEEMELAGAGALLKMLEDRKKRLEAEGLFNPATKKKLPYMPQRIGVVTSPTGAVIRDILHRLADRFPCSVLVWPVRVQGDGAGLEIAAAISGFNAMPQTQRPDLLIVARGGGSLEDLMPFNDEIVVRAAAASVIPLISAVGHETDTTLIDYAADLRAPTPTAAAEMAVPERLALLAFTGDCGTRLISALTRALKTASDHVRHVSARLAHPQRLLEIKTQQLDYLSNTLRHALEKRIQTASKRVVEIAARLQHPAQRLALARQNLESLDARLQRVTRETLEKRAQSLASLAKLLDVLSFKSVLGRGFAVIRDETGHPVTQKSQTTIGQSLFVQFADGVVKSNIEENSERP